MWPLGNQVDPTEMKNHLIEGDDEATMRWTSHQTEEMFLSGVLTGQCEKLIDRNKSLLESLQRATYVTLSTF